MYSLDFIELTKFLTSNYSIKSIENLTYKDKKFISELTYEQLEEYIPRSNWNRYFRNYTNINDAELSELWERIYIYRNQVAHSRGLSKNDFDEVTTLIEKTEKIIDEAFKHIFKIEIPQENFNIIVNRMSIKIEKLTKPEIRSFKSNNKIGLQVKDCYSNLYELIVNARDIFEKNGFVTSYIYLQRQVLCMPCFDLYKQINNVDYAVLGKFVVMYNEDKKEYDYLFIHNSGVFTVSKVYTEEFMEYFVNSIIEEANLIL